MKRILYALLLIVVLSGCAAFKQAKLDFDSCRKDPACWAEAVSHASEIKAQIGDVAGVVSPLPWVGPVASAVGGGIALISFLVAGGKKKREEGK